MAYGGYTAPFHTSGGSTFTDIETELNKLPVLLGSAEAIQGGLPIGRWFIEDAGNSDSDTPGALIKLT